MVPPVESDAAAEDRPHGPEAEAQPQTAAVPGEPTRAAGVEAAAPPAQEPLAPESAATAKADGKPAASKAPAGARARLREAAKSGASVQGKVVAIVRGGYEVDVEGIICICPFSQIELTPPRDQLVHARQVYEFKVTMARGKNITLSRRKILEKEARKAERKKMAGIKPGTEQDGVVVSLSDYGAFVNIDGVPGMIHVSEITHARIAKPADRLKIGDKVRVKVLKAARRQNRLSLSLKALEGDPWREVGKNLKAHTIVAGRVMRLTEFGAFVEVAPGVDGLIHISEIPEGQRDQYEKMAGEEAALPVHVLKVEAGKRRISLAPAPDGMQVGDKVRLTEVRPGKVVQAIVEKIDKSGVVVKIGQAQTALIPANETGTPRGADLAKTFKEGQEVRALVLRQERGDRRIRLSIRRAERQEERRQLDEYRKSSSSGAGSFATLGDIFKKIT